MPSRLEILNKRLSRNYNDYGLLITLKKAAFYIIRLLFINVNTIIYKIDIEINEKALPDSERFTFRLIDGKDLSYIKSIAEMAEWLEGTLAPDLLTGKKICMGVFEKEKLIGFYLAAFKRIKIPTLSMAVVLDHDEAWGEDIIINKNYRRKGISTALKYGIYSELKNRGIKCVYGCVGMFNNVSLNSSSKFWLEEATYLKFLKVLSVNKYYIRRIPSDQISQTMVNLTDSQRLSLFSILKHSVYDGDGLLLNLKGMKDERHLFTINTSELF